MINRSYLCAFFDDNELIVIIKALEPLFPELKQKILDNIVSAIIDEEMNNFSIHSYNDDYDFDNYDYYDAYGHWDNY